MWQCLKLPRFSIQTTEKLFMPNVMIVTFDSNTVYGARDSRPAGSWYTTNVSICQIARSCFQNNYEQI